MQSVRQDMPNAAWRWTFHSIGELRKALEEYTALIELTLQPQLGKVKGEDGAVAQQDVDVTYRIMAQNKEIDRRLARLVVESPFYARLLHWYYRTGNCCEAEGWRVAAKKAGLPSRKRMYRGQDMSRKQFEVQLDLSLRELFHTR